MATLTNKEKEELKPVLEAKPVAPAPTAGKPRPFVKNWKLDELAPVVEKRAEAGATSTAAGGCSARPTASPATASTTRAAPPGRT